MKAFYKLRAALRIGGINLSLFFAEDHFFGSSHASEYIYKIFKSASPDEYPVLIQEQYSLRFGIDFNIYEPRTFNEKLQWLKAFDSTPVKAVLADKYLARGWLEERIGTEYLVPLLGVWDRFDDIDFKKLPNQFALKCNHGSGWNLIVTDKSQLDLNDARSKFDLWMNLNYAFYSGELQYKDIPPKIIAEKYLDCSGGIKDYRFYCFNGEPLQVWVDRFSGTPNHVRSVFDVNWNKLNLKCTWPDGGDQLSDKPLFLEEMLNLSKIISKDFYFVRVDFFEVQEKLYIGEITFTPMTGAGVFEPPEWDKILGDYLKLPIKEITTTF